MTAIALATSRDIEMTSAEVVIIPTIPAHIVELCNNIRDGDRKEIEMCGVSCAEAIWFSYKQGLMNYTGIIDGEVAAVWGVGGSYLGNVGSPWLLTTGAIHKISPLRFAREYQREVLHMLKYFDILENYCDESYEQALRLLSIIGFTIGEPEMVHGAMHRKFTLIKGNS